VSRTLAAVLYLIAAALLTLPCDTASAAEAAPAKPPPGPLDPRGKIHIPIGIPNTLDSLKTFVEAEGNFSPGFATYGIYFWVYDCEAKKLIAPTMDGVSVKHGLAPGGLLIPWSEWKAGDIAVRTEVCQVTRRSPQGDALVAAARVTLKNSGAAERKMSLYAAIRPQGPAGGPIEKFELTETADGFYVWGHTALVAGEKPAAAGVVPTDTIGEIAGAGNVPETKVASSESGNCSGALQFDLTIPAGGSKTLGFICPVLAGRRAVAHQWDGKSQWAQFDLAKPNPPEGGILQPDAGLEYYRGLKADTIFEEATAFWKEFVGKFKVTAPDARWPEALAAIVGHAAIAMNDGAPDVAVVNYNVYNRDGVYTANILQKAGQFDLAAKAIDYFLAHPFNGRAYPEADNPGQILWIMGEQWLFTRDQEWLKRVYPGVRQLAAMIRYYRTTAGPHWVSMNSLKFGDALPKEDRQELKPGRCDGSHPEYTEAFDIAGLWRAAALARAMDKSDEARQWTELADEFLAAYQGRFAADLGKAYGSYCVLWPCRLFPLGGGPAYERFKKTGVQKPTGWRYFPLATAHQGLLAGNRDAAAGTIATHLDHEQMRGWYALDEGGKSGSGGWGFARTTWDPSVAMPHGWAIAEVWLLMRDALLFEDADRLVLLGGVPAEWLTGKQPIKIEGMPTYFGPCSYEYMRVEGGAVLKLTGEAAPAEGFILRLPATLNATVKAGGKAIKPQAGGDFLLPPGTKRAEIALGEVRP
jgi:hypothetical protein